MSTFIVDNQILWLCVDKAGTPPAWESGKNYQIGDIVVPRNPTPGQADLAFQVVAFVGKSGGTQPTWPIAEGDTVIDNNIEWIAEVDGADPAQLSPSQFYVIQKQITVS